MEAELVYSTTNKKCNHYSPITISEKELTKNGARIKLSSIRINKGKKEILNQTILPSATKRDKEIVKQLKALHSLKEKFK